ncbi:ATP synthase F1 subunit delta [Candidatus Falkowbacteria bacterium]|nr:ATP synthase F1 subunit delta [Candidatus Falkowbacteria bacterium]
MSKITVQHIASALYELTLDADSAGLKKVLKDFTSYLAKVGMLEKYQQVIDAYELLWDERNGVTTIRVQSRYPLNTQLQDEIANKFKKVLDAKSINIKNEVNDALLGGYKVYFKDTVYDYSLSGKLDQLSNHLVKNF